MLTRQWLSGVLRRRTARVVGLAACVALAVALVASLGAFITASNARMTTQAIAGVPVDWQVELASGTDVSSALSTIRSAAGVKAVLPVGYGDVASFVATTGPTVQSSGAGRALGLPPGYANAFPGEVRYLAGAHDGVLLAQQTAANLHVGVGDPLTMNLPGGGSAVLRVDGVIDLPAADSLFQVVGAPAGSGATAPPDNVVLLPLDRWNALFRPLAAAHPAAVRDQAHVTLAHALPSSPADAYTAVVARAHNLEAKFAGAAQVGDNLAAMLDAARADSVYSGLLFLFLGLPGVVLAWLLALVAGASGRDRRRREQALLRTRGASPRRLIVLAVAESSLVGVAGVLAGLGAAVVAARLAFGAGAVSPTSPSSLGWAAVAAAVGLALGFFAIALPAIRDARLLTVRASSAQMAVRKPPLWERLYLDVALLAGSGLIFWQSMRDAYQVVLVPEGVPTISINYLTLVAPMMFWAGFALLAWRLGALALERAPRAMSGLLRPLAGNLSGVVRASMSRQRGLLARGLVLVALALSFAVSVAVFNTTYMNQAVVDAQLTNGADVSLTAGASVLPTTAAARVAAVPGVQAAEPMQHRLAYVGNDLQDLFGIRPATIGNVTPMSDAFFQGGTAAQVLGRLAATPDGILVSDETVKDFQLQLGDTMRLRLQGTDRAYHEVTFHYVGVAREFPTAPHDSFLVANAAYVASATGVPGAETLLVKTTGATPITVAARIRTALGPASGISVHDLQSELKITLSALTAIDLSGLTRLELFFAVLMGAAASGLMLLLGFAERRRMFAIAHALGASTRQLASFVWAEALFTATGGALLGALGGWLEALIIVKILTGVFDPPPEGLSVPWAYLGLVLAVVAASIVVAVTLAVRAGRRPALEVIRDL
jgi:putative ABC transport system permease protein